MKQTVYKYPVPVEDEFTLEMPCGSHILCVQTQRDEAQIWAIVEPAAEPEERRFALRGTGHPVDDGLAGSNYIGTFQLDGGTLVFHLFERD